MAVQGRAGPVRYLPQNEYDEGEQQQASDDAANQDPEGDGNGAALQDLQHCLHGERVMQ